MPNASCFVRAVTIIAAITPSIKSPRALVVTNTFVAAGKFFVLLRGLLKIMKISPAELRAEAVLILGDRHLVVPLALGQQHTSQKYLEKRKLGVTAKNIQISTLGKK